MKNEENILPAKAWHESVMVREVIENLHINIGSLYIDGTLGTGGHALEIIKAGGQVLGIEADPAMLAIARKRLEIEIEKNKTKLVLGNFVSIDTIANENSFTNISGIVLDLGVTNLHLTGEDRGFSFSNSNLKSGLDMRLNPQTQGVKASDLLNALRADQLTDLFEVTMDKSSARWLVARILESRPINTVGEFKAIADGLKHKAKLNPLTLPFLALRIAVNNELDNLEVVLPKAFELLQPKGRLLVITFHSGEDRIVKKFRSNILVLPSTEEISKNPKARSAKLRVFEKL